MHDAIKAVRAGAPIARAEAEAARHLTAAGFTSVDYVAIRDAETLAPIGGARASLRAFWRRRGSARRG